MQNSLSLSKFTQQKLLAKLLFWLHIFVILGALFAGLILPWPVVIAMVIVHRTHIYIFNGCALSKLQTYIGDLPADMNFLQQASERLFKRTISKAAAHKIDISIVITAALLALFKNGVLQISPTVLAFIISAGGGYISWRLYKAKQAGSFKTVCNDTAKTCEVVADSSYSQIGNIPVALIGVGYFALVCLLLISTSLLGLAAGPLLLLITSGGVLASLYFVYCQFALIKQFCKACMLSHAASLGLFVVTLVPLLNRF